MTKVEQTPRVVSSTGVTGKAVVVTVTTTRSLTTVLVIVSEGRRRLGVA